MWEPDNYKNDPYGYLTNQIGHIYLGFFLTTLYCFVLQLFMDFPNQNIAVVTVVALYFIVWELLYQEWRGFDSLEDTFYVLLGASTFVGDFIDMRWVINELFLFFSVANFFLLVGYAVRLINAKRFER